MNPELSVILPVRNQADHITGVVERFVSEFGGRPWEIVLVPNACRDESPSLCRDLAGKNKNIRVVENPAGGWGLSVRMGLEAAKGRHLCYSNSARTDPATIPALYEVFLGHPGCLAKIRRHDRGNLLREAGSLLYNIECRLLFGLSCRDVNGTPKIMEADLFPRMRLTSDKDLLDAEVLARCRRLGVPVVEMPLAGFTRHGGKSTTDLKSAARMYGGALRLWTRMP